jgi:hypothetical protein
MLSVSTVGKTLYNHKFKVILAILLGYGAKKCYDMYTFIRPFLQMKNQITGGGGGELGELAKLLGGSESDLA